MIRSKLVASAAALAFSAVPVVAIAGTVQLSASLSGANETAGGDADGSGKLVAEIDPDAGDFCYTLSGAAIDAPTAAHIHEGAAGADGKAVIKLEVTGDEDDECVAVEPDTLKAIIAAPENFYANIHTAAFPAGAVRGQLGKGG